jgi:CubicO group peptidase (beta-lactamase class C family)
MTADLQAPIGSITESFTVTIAQQLFGEGKLRLEDTIERWDPQIAEASATATYRRNMISLTN